MNFDRTIDSQTYCNQSTMHLAHTGYMEHNGTVDWFIPWQFNWTLRINEDLWLHQLIIQHIVSALVSTDTRFSVPLHSHQ